MTWVRRVENLRITARRTCRGPAMPFPRFSPLEPAPPRVLVAQGVQKADTLRRREDKVETGDGGEPLRLDPALVGERIDPLNRDHPRLGMAAQLLLGVRMVASNQASELTLVHDALEL